MRLDQYLKENNFFASREKAQDAIKKGIVKVNGKIETKASFPVESPVIEITEELLPYVSWGGMKLERAIDYFNLDFKDKVVLDIGSSTGGFTDCSLKHGAKEVYAVDVGSNQLHESLRKNPKVHSFENANIIDFNPNIKFDILVMDVSFVSITKIIPALKKFLTDDTYLVCLFKPQFELGGMNIKNGVVKDPKLHMEVINDLTNFILASGLYVNGLTYSTQKGKMGNIEYLAIVSSKNERIGNIYNVRDIVLESHRM